MKKKRLNAKEINFLSSINSKLSTFSKKLPNNLENLNFGNGTIKEQISIAIAAIDTILQEY